MNDILITGSSRGIGKETALYLAKNGYDIVLHCNKNIEKLKSNSHIKISVSHTGMGLAESEIEGIFEPYLQLGKNSKKMLNRSIILGTSALIVKQLKGSIWVESEVMKGSTFNIILPVEKENENTNE